MISRKPHPCLSFGTGKFCINISVFLEECNKGCSFGDFMIWWCIEIFRRPPARFNRSCCNSIIPWKLLDFRNVCAEMIERGLTEVNISFFCSSIWNIGQHPSVINKESCDAYLLCRLVTTGIRIVITRSSKGKWLYLFCRLVSVSFWIYIFYTSTHKKILLLQFGELFFTRRYQGSSTLESDWMNIDISTKKW